MFTVTPLLANSLHHLKSLIATYNSGIVNIYSPYICPPGTKLHANHTFSSVLSALRQSTHWVKAAAEAGLHRPYMAAKTSQGIQYFFPWVFLFIVGAVILRVLSSDFIMSNPHASQALTDGRMKHSLMILSHLEFNYAFQLPTHWLPVFLQIMAFSCWSVITR